MFYLVFTVFSGAIGHKSAAKGVAFARAVSIVFLLNELEHLVYYQEQLEAISSKEDATHLGGNSRLDFIESLFSKTFCIFEIIELERLVFY